MFPDLIVHKRGENSKGHNLLVIEAKKHWEQGTDGYFDTRKLEAYQAHFGYRYAVFLELTARPRWRWLPADQMHFVDPTDNSSFMSAG